MCIMVTLNTGNTTIPSQPISLYKKEKSFSILGDWLAGRKEIKAKGFKHYYAFIQRTCGERGYCYLKNETIAERLGCCTKTIQNYHAISQEHNLITIISSPHGRSSLFVINYHPWMGISEGEATKLKPELPAEVTALVSKLFPPGVQSFPADTLQIVENTEDLVLLETYVENHVEEVKSMQACKASQPTINITDSNIDEEKETPVINVSTTPSASKDSEKEPILSKHSLEMCKRYTLAYAKAKSMTKYPITDIRGFSLYCFRTGKEDIWIDAFIENNYSITPINPSKDPQVEQPQEQPQVTKQTYKKKNKSVENKEIKGKYPYQVYLDFVNYEIKQGQNIRSVEGLTRHLHTTGSQDSQVASFVELMKNTYAGGKVPQTQNVNSAINSTSNNTDPTISCTSIDTTITNGISTTGTISTTNQQSSPSPQPPSVPTTSVAEDVEAIRRTTAIESLAVTAWQTLTSTQKEQLLKQIQSNLLETKSSIYAQMPKETLTSHINVLVKRKIGEMLYNSNTGNLTALLQAIGKEKFDSLEDWEKFELQEPKIDAMGYFYSCCENTQSALLQEVSEEIYLELGIEQLA
ncbi:MAG: hypothetical protein HYR87_07405, partial [Thaumarchaeota archaeon]|nr:hypothetical protein [Nitrososphaerota archaeon]